MRALGRGDIREQGSGNIGATNVWRMHGPPLGIAVTLLDAAKGFVPTLVALQVAGSLAAVVTGAAAMAGHSRPLFLRFARGGKMVATGGGVFFALAPLVMGIGLLVWILVAAMTRYASVASIVTALSIPLLCALFGEDPSIIALAAIAATLIIVLHRANVGRLRVGTESRLSFWGRRRAAHGA